MAAAEVLSRPAVSRRAVFKWWNDGTPDTSPPPNLPSGWAAFRLLRCTPSTDPDPRRHGNCRHGDYSAEGIARRRETRALLRWIKGRGPRPLMAPPPGEGWRLWRGARGQGRVMRHLPRAGA